VLVDRIHGDHQLFGDARVRRARGQQRQDLQLAGGQLLDQARHRRADGLRGARGGGLFAERPRQPGQAAKRDPAGGRVARLLG
jgi:hypothetical protein